MELRHSPKRYLGLFKLNFLLTPAFLSICQIQELSFMSNVVKEREDENMESKRKENQKWSLIFFDWCKNRRVPHCPSSHWGPFDYCAVNCPRLDAPPEIGPEICGSRADVEGNPDSGLRTKKGHFLSEMKLLSHSVHSLRGRTAAEAKLTPSI